MKCQKFEAKKAILAKIAIEKAKTISIKEGNIEAIGVIFKPNGKIYKYNPDGNIYKPGDIIMINDYNKKPHIAAIVFGNRLVAENSIIKPFKYTNGDISKIEIKEAIKGENNKEELDSTDNDKEELVKEVLYSEETKLYQIIKISKTFEGKLCSLDDNVKKAYSDLKNALLNLGLTPRISKTKETYSYKRKKYAVIRLTKKNILLYLNVDPNKYANTKYKGDDVGNKKTYQDTPFLYKAGTPRKNKWALELIADLGYKAGILG